MFLGFYWFKEWDNTWSSISARSERADLSDYLRCGVDEWVHVTYQDGVTHRVDRRYFDERASRKSSSEVNWEAAQAQNRY
jgi:hypothetical protein